MRHDHQRRVVMVVLETFVIVVGMMMIIAAVVAVENKLLVLMEFVEVWNGNERLVLLRKHPNLFSREV